MHRFANPGRFLRLANRIQPWLKALTLLGFALGFYLALIGSPPDYQQGDTVRIMYIHVPAAWMALFTYLLLGLSSASSLIWRHPLADVAAEAMSPIGAAFTLLALITGSLWGKPMWGTFWVWDARLTSFLLLFFLYLGHMALLGAFDDRSRGQRSAAVLALVGLINLPVIKFSVDWWNTLHQPASIVRAGGISIDPSMQWPLFTMAAAFHCFLLAAVIERMRTLLLEARLRNQRLAAFDRLQPGVREVGAGE
jgi:heme exporter protein C